MNLTINKILTFIYAWILTSIVVSLGVLLMRNKHHLPKYITYTGAAAFSSGIFEAMLLLFLFNLADLNLSVRSTFETALYNLIPPSIFFNLVSFVLLSIIVTFYSIFKKRYNLMIGYYLLTIVAAGIAAAISYQLGRIFSFGISGI